MKNLNFIILVLGLFLLNGNATAQEEPLQFKFNRIDYFAPAGPLSGSENKTFKNTSYITIDVELEEITVLTYFSDPPTESIYKIQDISELNSDKGQGKYYKITTLATNYATVIFELNIDGNWIKRKIPHNGISHTYYYE